MKQQELEIQEKIGHLVGKVEFSGDKIEYFFNEVSVGKIDLPNYSMMEIRHILASILKIREYNNFHIIRSNGNIIDGSKVFINNLQGDVDMNVDMGKYEGDIYNYHESRLRCKECGRIHYKPKFS